MKLKGMLILAAVFLLQALIQPVYAADTRNAKGGINILKTDVLGNGLPGASYQIAREATQSELLDSSVAKRLLKIGEDTLTVVYASFWDSREMTGEKKTEAATDDAGCAAMYGLPYGTYYLVESKAPEGYDRMTAPIRVTVNKYSHLTADDDVRDDADTVIDNTLHIVTIRYSLPETGEPAYSRISKAVAGLAASLGVLVCLLRIRYKWAL